MPSGHDHASRLQAEMRRMLAAHLLSFEDEFRALRATLSSSASAVDQITARLGSTRGADVSPVEAIFAEAISDANRESVRSRDEERSFLAHFAHEIRQKETQEEILNLLLDAASRFAPRLVLFVVRESQFVAWSSRGIEACAAAKLDGSVLAPWESPLLRSALEADGLTTADDHEGETCLSVLLPDGRKDPWHAFPLKAIRRPIAVLLALAAEGRTCDLEPLCVLMDLTGLCVENMALRILHEMQSPKPIATTGAEAQPAAPPPAEPAAAAPDESPVEPEAASADAGGLHTPIPPEEPLEPEIREAVPEPVPEVVASETVSQEALATPVSYEPQVEPVLEAAPAESVFEEVPVAPLAEELTAAPIPEAAPAAEAADQLEAEEIVPEIPAVEEALSPVPEIERLVEPETAEQIRPLTPPVPEEHEPVESPPPETAKPEGAPFPHPATEVPEPVRSAVLREVQPLSEEEKLHADAKRFARLLASEIKLYNEQRVVEGRQNRDLYVRLKRDIDRSRDMYERRISPVVSRRVDYFHDELVRILGENDPSAMGSDYPGPRVES